MEYVIEMNNITKIFGNFKALDDVTFKVKKGEVHALLGENGAGKSTLMSVLFGLYQAEKGNISINGKPVKINNPNDANSLKIGMVHQHFKLVHNFTVLESIILGRETVNMGVLKKDDARKKVMDLSNRYKLKINPDSYISDITVGMQQRVEILKMLYSDSDILIFDEPTAVLTPQEIEELMKVMKELVKEGKSIVFISHKLNEIKEVADRCTILRKGKYIGTVDVSTTTKEQMSEMMVGRKINFNIEKKDIKTGESVLEVRNLVVKAKNSKKNVVNNVSFDVKKGEILCIAGIDGNGQSELVYGITGLIPINEGNILLNGKDITKESIRKKCVNGMAHIPEDRHKHGLILDFDVKQNSVLQTYFEPRFQRNGFIKFNAVKEYAKKLIKQYDIRSPRDEDSVVRNMSGGNQQKLIVARELDRNPDIVLAVQPTRGLDIGATEYIHKQLIAQRDQEKAVLLVSLELDEVMDVSDRILVIYEGEIVGDLNPKEITLEELGLYMAGSKGVINMRRTKLLQSEGFISLLSSLMAIAAGLLVGLIILLISNSKDAIPAFFTILKGGFEDGSRGIGQVIYFAIPIIMTGLSVGFAFKTGLFNIGASGQFTCGAFVAIYIGIKWTFVPAEIHWLVALIGAMIAGAIWGSGPGMLKAFFNVNEVITSIMMNYIGMYLVNMTIVKTVYDSLKNQTKPVLKSAILPKAGLDKLFNTNNVNIGIFIVLIAVVVIYIILQKTTFGYELKACGSNKEASKYAGINEKKNIILSMVIAGALSGLGGGLLYLSGSGKYIHVLDVLASEGFSGISVALLGMSHPIGILFSGLFIAHLEVGGFNIQLYNFVPEIIDMIIAVIIYCGAFALLFRQIMNKLLRKPIVESIDTADIDEPLKTTSEISTATEYPVGDNTKNIDNKNETNQKEDI